jgi:hypothetical protein
MDSLRKIVIAVSIILMASILVPSVKAESGTWKTQVTFDKSVQVGDLTLSPGTYEFRVCRDTINRSIVKIYNMDAGRWEGFVMGIKAEREDHPRMSGFAVETRGHGASNVLRYWFHPGESRGVEFTYAHTS